MKQGNETSNRRQLEEIEKLNPKRGLQYLILNQAGIKDNEVKYTYLLRQAAGRLPQSKYSIMTQDNILVLLPPNTNLEDCGNLRSRGGKNLGAHYILVRGTRFNSSGLV